MTMAQRVRTRRIVKVYGGVKPKDNAAQMLKALE